MGTDSEKVDKLLEVSYHIAREVERFNNQFEDLYAKYNAHDRDIAVLNTKAGIWGGTLGALFGAITSAVIGAIVWALGGKHP